MAAFLFWLSVIVIFYILFGYPLIIALLAKIKKEKFIDMLDYPSVTLVIPAYNEEKFIEKKIQNSLELDYSKGKLEILVAADGSSDRTPEIVKKYEDKGIILNHISQRGGKMAAINRAVPITNGEIIVFSDANNLYEKDTIKNLVAPFAMDDVGGTTGAKLIIEDERELSSAEGLYWKYESNIKKNESVLGSCSSAVGEILAIRKSLFVTPPENIINDDHYLVLDLIRRGYRVLYIPEAKSYEYVSPTAKDEIVRRRRMNAGLFQTISLSRQLLPKNVFEVWKIISHKYSRAIMPFAMVFALIGNILAVIFPASVVENKFIYLAAPYNWIILTGQLLFYGIALFGNIKKFGGKIGKLIYLPTFFVNSNFAIFGGLVSFIKNSNSHIWERVNRVEIN